MWISAHETWKQFLMRHVTEWAAANRMSKHTAVDEIIAAHKAIGGPNHSGAYFDPNSKDEYNRMKANCTAFFRYAEDQDDEKNIFDMLPSILAALPVKDRINFMSQYLRPAGLSVSLIEDDAEEGFSMTAAIDTQLVLADAMKTMSAAALDPTPENLAAAEQQAERAVRRFDRTRKMLAGARSKCKGLFQKLIPAKV